MTNINITQNKNTVTVNGETRVVTAITVGPQGANAAMIDTDNAVNKSIVYYDGSSSSLKANSTWTTDTLTKGGNF